MRLLSVLTSAALVLAACGTTQSGGTPAASPGAGSGGGKTAVVTVQGFAFSPKTLEVAVGTTVTWTNLDSAPHTTTSGTPVGAQVDTSYGSGDYGYGGAAATVAVAPAQPSDVKWDGKLDPKSGTFSFTFTKPGTYAYYCTLHGASMTGTIVVR